MVQPERFRVLYAERGEIRERNDCHQVEPGEKIARLGHAGFTRFRERNLSEAQNENGGYNNPATVLRRRHT